MRCKNCGWINPVEIEKCEKCHSPLHICPFGEDRSPLHAAHENIRSTVSENVIFNATKPTVSMCPKCGYPLGSNTHVCPNCNNRIVDDRTIRHSLKCSSCGELVRSDSEYCPKCGSIVTMPERSQQHCLIHSPSDPLSKIEYSYSSASEKYCTLMPISWVGENILYNPITYNDEIIVLNRANTDPNNMTILSDEHAALIYENNEWYIENRSELKSTLIRVSGRIKLTDGDIIILGNREFVFNSK